MTLLLPRRRRRGRGSHRPRLAPNAPRRWYSRHVRKRRQAADVPRCALFVGAVIAGALLTSCAGTRAAAQLRAVDDSVEVEGSAVLYTVRDKCPGGLSCGSIFRSVLRVCPARQVLEVSARGLPPAGELGPGLYSYRAWYRVRGESRWRPLRVMRSDEPPRAPERYFGDIAAERIVDEEDVAEVAVAAQERGHHHEPGPIILKGALR